jgi:DNA-binding phage protein
MSPLPGEVWLAGLGLAVRARVARDPKVRKELLREGIGSLLTGDIATAKTILRDYINATVGFAELAEATHIPSKSLMRMLGPSGNPRADNLLLWLSVFSNDTRAFVSN